MLSGSRKFRCCILFILLAAAACRTPPKTDLRKLVPADALIYLETNNVAETLHSLADSPAFQELAIDKPDFSAFENTQMAIVVTDFEFSESQVDGENSILNFKLQFVVVAETHAWSWQARSLAENQLSGFVKRSYGDDVNFVKKDQDGGTFLTWTAKDNRQVFAFVRDSLIYFGNNPAAIEKCLAVKKNEAESLAVNESFTKNYSDNNLAFGYVSPAGVIQIAHLAGVFAAAGTTEEAGERNFIARILPQVLQNSIKEIVWTANKSEYGIEDKFSIALDTEMSLKFREIFTTPSTFQTNASEFLPADFVSATHYNLKNPLTAWRGLFQLTANNTDALSNKILSQFSNRLLEPYGFDEAETFLNSIDSEITTAQFDTEGTKSVVIATVKDTEKLKSSISKEIDFQASPAEQENAKIWFSGDKEFAAAFIENKLIIGDGESVLKCLQAKRRGEKPPANQKLKEFSQSTAVASTFGEDADSAEKLAGILAKMKSENRKLATFYLTETNFTEKGIERRTVSDFGFIGTILKLLNQ